MNTISNSVTVRVLALLLVVFFSVGGCGGSGGEDEDGVNIFVTLTNPITNEFPIHILSPGESLSPDNQLAPGESREVFIGLVEEGEAIVFRAGRNGVICQEIACTPFLNQEFFQVTWDELENVDLFDLFCDDGFNGRVVIDFLKTCPLF
ncbi:MAG TPA: hypothetical protein VLG45_10140 [Thermodesulfobacteriota bacterium]|nr:hypothetical protein [Thermodesulfobacteriota bacterium]